MSSNVLITVIVLIVVVFLNVKLNSMNEADCKAKGGEYYRALKVSRSLCKTAH